MEVNTYVIRWVISLIFVFVAALLGCWFAQKYYDAAMDKHRSRRIMALWYASAVILGIINFFIPQETSLFVRSAPFFMTISAPFWAPFFAGIGIC